VQFGDILYRYVHHLVGEDPFLGKVSHVFERHSGKVMYHNETDSITTEMKTAGAEISITQDEVLSYDIESVSTKLYDFENSVVDQTARGLFGNLGQVTNFVGNEVDARGKPFSFDLLLETLERIQVEFDDSGEPQLPTLIAPPNVVKNFKRLNPTPEQNRRYNEIMERKRKDYLAKKRYRKLPTVRP
jgi:hypothetical protein